MIIVELALFALLLFIAFSGIQVLFAFVFLYVESSLGSKINVKLTIKPKLNSMVKAFFFEWLVKLGVRFISYPILLFRKYQSHEDSESGSKRCIVLMHGYSRNEVDWIWFKNNLNIDGDIVTPTLPLVDDTLYASAQALAAVIIKLSEHKKYDEFVLVGHSMGGVISSLAAESFDFVKNKTTKVVTIGSPFHGTKISALGVGTAARELLPKSKPLAELRDKVKVSSIDYYAIVTNIDHMILPWDATIVENMKYKVVDGVGHMQMIYNQDVLSTIEDLIEGKTDSEESNFEVVHKFL